MGKAPEESHGEKVPLWIISFADMITLLLSFFVMLQTMAKSQDAKLLGASRESFRRAIAGLGIPDFLFGEQKSLDLEYRKLKYPVDESSSVEVPRNRIIDADDEQIRMVFDDIRKKMETKTSENAEEVTSVLTAPIEFDRNPTELGPPAREFLDGLARNLQQEAREGNRHIYVVGVAAEEPTPRQQWLTSAQRAGTVAEYLSERLPGKRWRVSSWGAGRGNARLHAMGAIPGKSCIVIAIAEVRKDNG